MASSPEEPQSSSAPSAAPQRVLLGILFVVLAVSILPVLNATAKYLSTDYGTVQIVWARYAGQLACMVIAFAPRYGVALFATRHPWIQILRSFLLLGSTVFAFTAIRFVALTTFTTINFTTPLMITALSTPILGEYVGPRRWAAVLVGVAGALIVIRPGLGATHPAAFLVLLTAVCYAFYQLLTRKIAADERPITTVTYAAVVGTVAASFFLPLDWKTPEGALPIALFFALGVIAGLGHYCLVKAYQHAPAPILSPFLYGHLIGATALDYAIFGLVPDLWTWIGAAIIIASGLYVTYRESRPAPRVR